MIFFFVIFFAFNLFTYSVCVRACVCTCRGQNGMEHGSSGLAARAFRAVPLNQFDFPYEFLTSVARASGRRIPIGIACSFPPGGSIALLIQRPPLTSREWSQWPGFLARECREGGDSVTLLDGLLHLRSFDDQKMLQRAAFRK